MVGGYRAQDVSTYEVDVRIMDAFKATSLVSVENEEITGIYTQLVNGVNTKIVFSSGSCFKIYCPFNRAMPCSEPKECEDSN
jgi:hypothetical protein